MVIRIPRVVQIEPLHDDDYDSDQALTYLDHATPSLGLTRPDWELLLSTAV